MSRRALIGIMLLVLFAGGAYFVVVMTRDRGGDEAVGFIRAVTTNGNYGITFDEALFLTGTEGEDAAIAAGRCTDATRSSCLPNDFIISNESETTDQLEFATGIRITMQTLGMEQDGVQEREITKQEFERLINDPQAEWRQLPYRVTKRSGLVVAIEEIYVP